MAQTSPLTQALRLVSPVPAGTNVMRQDQGQDYQGHPGQNVVAIGPGHVDYIKADPGGFGDALYYTLANGQQIYVGHAQPTVRQGQPLTAGQPVAQLLAQGGGNAGSLPGWTEVGLASGGVPAYRDGTEGGQAFSRFLASHGAGLVGGQPSAAAPQSPLVAAVTAELRKYPRVDPQAALAVAAQEGLSGGVGDNGTSFGPFQLHQGGALPGTVPLTGAQQWASSPAGIDYALGRIQGVAGGLHGADAVRAIVSQFERPANPQSEIQRALQGYGASVPPLAAAAAGGTASPRPQGASRPGPLTAQVMRILNQGARTVGLPALSI